MKITVIKKAEQKKAAAAACPWVVEAMLESTRK
jgi:hypothetical protein